MSPEADWYADSLSKLRTKATATEADVSGALVRPVLELILKFGVEQIDAESQSTGKRLRPDFICRDPDSPFAHVIVEVKRLGTDLQKRSGRQGWSTSPVGQLHRYLNQHRRSGAGTWGLLTNGAEWLVVQREGDRCREEDFGNIQTAESLQRVRALLKGITANVPESRSTAEEPPTPDWLEVLADCKSPSDFVARVAPDADAETKGNGTFAKLAEHSRPGNLFPVPSHLACIELNLPDGYVAPQDIAEELRTGGWHGYVAGVAYTRAQDGRRLVRGFYHDDDRLLTTALVEPDLPGSRALSQFAALSADADDPSSNAIADALSSDPLHRSFHEEISAWFKSGLQGDVRKDGNRLRHLIRVMFAWLLQVRGVLPDDALWLPTKKPGGKFAVHRHILWLFSDILATPEADRENESDQWRQSLVESVPFLNGSLFSKLPGREQPEPIANAAYLDGSGLFPILRRYDWTLSNRTGYGSESAVDPSMLGEMFERLMLDVEGVRTESDGRRRMPDGSYYTPQDIADEMAADAIGKRLSQELPDIEWREARSLAHPTPSTESWQEWSAPTKRKASNILRETTVFDPCCGSGVFTLSMLYGLWRAKGRLSRKPLPASDLEDIIERQLYAADIHPTAVLITRLRLFIALVDVRAREEGTRPLPNLETRCMAANTLCVKPGPQFAFGGKEWDAGIDDLRAAREAWTSAHHPDEKAYALEQEGQCRRRLREVGSQWSEPGELEWLDADFLSASAPAAEFDVRQLFPAPRGGWDIVIGNPPYQRPDKPDQARAKRFGYTDTSANLYLMFIEAALTVAKDNGCVTLVVPHSIVFGGRKAFSGTRELIEDAATSVDIRTYNNRPQPLFPNLPWLKTDGHNDNLQRCTVLVIQMRGKRSGSPQPCTIKSRGLIRLEASRRGAALRDSTEGTPQPTLGPKWSQAPTKELGDLLLAMNGPQRPDVGVPKPKVVTFPMTAAYFITCLPDGMLKTVKRKPHTIAGDKFYWPWLGLYNSHLFHAYWLMVGDAFHINTSDFATVRRPPGWDDEALRSETERTARRLMHSRTLQACRADHVRLDRPFQNYDFHGEGTPGPAIVRRLDELLLEAYDLAAEPLMSQMRTIRTSSAHLL